MYLLFFANGISRYTSPLSPSTKEEKSPQSSSSSNNNNNNNRSSSLQCVHLSYLYKDTQGYTPDTHTLSHTHGPVSIHRIIFRQQQKVSEKVSVEKGGKVCRGGGAAGGVWVGGWVGGVMVTVNNIVKGKWRRALCINRPWPTVRVFLRACVCVCVDPRCR